MPADNHFDHSSWPGAKPHYEESEQSPTIALTQDGKVVTGPIHIVTGQKIILGVQTTNYEGETIQEGIDDGNLMDISLGDAIELENLPVGKHTLTVQLPDQPEVKQQVSIIVSGYLTLDENPNLQFGSKDLKQYTIAPNYQLVDGNVSSSSGSEGNDHLSVKVTDNRYTEEQSPEPGTYQGKLSWTLNNAPQ